MFCKGLSSALVRVLVVSLALACLLPLATSLVQASGLFVVTNTNDSGPGSLRQAILDANNQTNPPGALITFNIPKTDPGYGLNTAGVWTIRPLNLLPDLKGGATTIDGLTQKINQGDTNPLGPSVEIDGVNLGGTAAVFYIESGYNTIRELAINDAGWGLMILGTPTL
jgi:hypothetical protein